MRRVAVVAPAGSWPIAEAVATVTLDYDDRQRRRLAMTDDRGEAFLLDLPRTAGLKDGDGLVIDGDAGIIGVRAAEEAIADLYPAGAMEMARLAWHLGNRHAPVQVLADGAIRIRDDGVLLDMVRKLGIRVRRHHAPFESEAGAYLVDGHTHPQPTGVVEG